MDEKENMNLDKKLLWEKIKENKGLVFNIILTFFFLISLYQNFVFYNHDKEIDRKEIIKLLDEQNNKNYNILKQIKNNVDSIHVEQRNTIERIDGTQASIKLLEKQRNEKIKYVYINNADSTVKLLRNRYSKLP